MDKDLHAVAFITVKYNPLQTGNNYNAKHQGNGSLQD